MKTIKYLSLLFCAILLAQCDSQGHKIPRATTYTVTTEPATKISATSATLSFTIRYNSGDEGYERSGFFLNSDLSEAKTIYTDGRYLYSVVVTDLSPKTKYYYQAFIEDRLGNQIKGETLSFTTARELITVTTLAAKNIGSTTANIYLC
ncbi:MAG: fibronectin type III domain-containing protein, partial [Mucinivorans sp.]